MIVLQNGELSDTPWHVYSNPFEPHIYPVLALAKYLFSNPDIIKSKSTLFPGNNKYSRYVSNTASAINKTSIDTSKCFS